MLAKPAKRHTITKSSLPLFRKMACLKERPFCYLCKLHLDEKPSLTLCAIFTNPLNAPDMLGSSKKE